MNSLSIRRALFDAALGICSPTLRSSIIEDAAFLDRYGRQASLTIDLWHAGPSIDRSAFLGALRTILSGGQAAEVQDVQGSKLTMTGDKSSIVLKTAEGATSHVPDFYQLSFDKSHRVQMFLNEAGKLRLHPSRTSHWSQLLEERPVDDEEFIELLDDLNMSPLRTEEKICSRLQSGHTSVPDLVPASKIYYESLVGGYDGSATIQEYGTRVLKHHLRLLLGDGSYDGLRLCFRVLAHQSIPDLLDLSTAEPAVILSVYESIEKSGDPISVVGAIELGLTLIPSMPQLEEVIQRLIQKLHDDSADSESVGFGLLSSIFILVDGEISRLKLFANTPPFYRRLAALAHSSLLFNQVSTVNVIAQAFSDWVVQLRGMNFYAQTYADMRLEPRWGPDHIMGAQIKFDFLSRIVFAAHKHKQIIERCQILNMVIGKEPGSLASELVFPYSFMPGPLEGAIDENQTLPIEIVETIDQQLNSDDETPARFFALLNAAHIFKIDEEYTSTTTDILKNKQHHLANIKDKAQLMSFLFGLANLSAVTRGKQLAEEIRILLRVYRHDQEFELEVSDCLRLGLRAAASYQELSDWCDYVGFIIGDLAFGELSKKDAHLLDMNIHSLTTCIPQLWRTCAKADAAVKSYIGSSLP